MRLTVLALVLSWLPALTDCRGMPEVMGHYEVTYYVGDMVMDQSCPLSDTGQPQACALWDTYVAVTEAPSLTLPEPAVGQVIAWHDDAAVAVDAAGNRSTDACAP